MSIEIATLNTIDPDLVQQQLLVTTALLQEAYPELDLKRGVFHDTVALFHAQLTAGERVNLRRYLASRSLLAISADPTLADTDVMDHLLSNWELERQPASKSSGEVTIVLSQATGWTFSIGSRFLINGRTYVTRRLFSAEPDEALLRGPSDRLMVPLSDGSYAFTIEVEALETGEAYRVLKDTLVTPVSVPLNFVTAYATSDFAGGEDPEPNAELLRRMQQGIAARGFASVPANLAALLRNREDTARFQDMSVVGIGFPEMLRDRHSIFPISFGGRIDWYIRTQKRLWRLAMTKTATLVRKIDGVRGIWQFAIAADEAPGFYEVRKIRPDDAQNVAGGFEITSEVRGLDLTGDGFIPDILTQAEGAYTAYQTAVIQFHDTVTDTSELEVGATKTYSVEAACLPLIGTIQELAASFDDRTRTADVLVKAPVPCFVQLNFTLYKRADQADPDLLAIREALVNTVNSIGFVGRIYASQLYDVIHMHLYNNTSVGLIDMFGRIRRPDGTTLYLRDAEVLRLDDEPEQMVTSNTVQFFLEPEDIAISVETSIPMPV